MIHRLASAFVVGLVVVSGGLSAGATSVDDQGGVDNALAASAIRMLQAGFWSAGPGTRESNFVSGCLGGLDSPGQFPPVEGETARAVSNVYLFQPDAALAPTVGELVTSAVVTVDDAYQPGLDWFVLLIGAQETAECRRTEYLDSPDVGAADVAPDVEVVATSGLGIADASSRLDMDIVFTTAGVQHRVAYSYLVARSGRALVIVRTATYGDESSSGFDPQVELASIADFVGAPSG